MKNFKVGDPVFWKSQSGGYSKEKFGNIHYIIPPNESVLTQNHSNNFNPGYYGKYTQMFDGGLPRDHESYIVIVPSKSGKGKSKIYWPRVSALNHTKP